MPVGFTSGCTDALFVEDGSNAVEAFTFKVERIDAFDDLGLFFVDDKFAFGSSVVSEESPKGNGDFSVCEAFTLSPCAVFRDGPRFFLGKAAHDGDEQFAFRVKRPDIFFLEEALASSFFELTDGSETVNGIACETRHRLSDNQVYFAVESISDHALEAFAAFGVRTGDALVGVDADKLPVLSGLDVVLVVVDLRFIAGVLLVRVRRHACVGGDLASFYGVDG